MIEQKMEMGNLYFLSRNYRYWFLFSSLIPVWEKKNFQKMVHSHWGNARAVVVILRSMHRFTRNKSEYRSLFFCLQEKISLATKLDNWDITLGIVYFAFRMSVAMSRAYPNFLTHYSRNNCIYPSFFIWIIP